MRRNCHDCCNTDRGLNRNCEPVSKRAKKSADLDNMRGFLLTQDEAKALKKHVSEMTPDERVVWYQREADKRKEEDANARRIFDKPKGLIQQGQTLAQVRDKDYDYENYEDWAVRQIILKRVSTEGEAIKFWKAKLAEVGAKVIEERGEMLLGRFKGVRITDRHSKLNRRSHEFKSCSENPSP